jgi:hypothetical protein
MSKRERKFLFEFDNMPIMSPVTIDTKHHGFWGALWCWLVTTRKWKIEESWLFYIDGEQYIIEEGFVFDGASVPKYFRSWLSPMGVLLIAGLVHDWGYKYASLAKVMNTGTFIPVEKNQKEMDIIFREVAVQVNGFGFINGIAYYVLRACGFFAWNGHRKRDPK